MGPKEYLLAFALHYHDSVVNYRAFALFSRHNLHYYVKQCEDEAESQGFIHGEHSLLRINYSF